MSEASEVEQTRRNIPGTTLRELYTWAPFSLEDSDGPFGIQEYIQQSQRLYPDEILKLVKCPEDQDENVWVYEQLRQFLIDMNQIVVILAPVCTSSSCPKMIASKYEFLCAAHGKPQECSAIDYVIHTLEGFQDMLNEKEMFPSRVRVPAKSMQALSTLPRRMIRVFAHAFFHHREQFDLLEGKMFLCSRFIAFSKQFHLLKDDQILIDLESLPLKVN